MSARIEIEDGFGSSWQGCRRGAVCGLEVVRPGKVQCWCDYRTADGSCLHHTGVGGRGGFDCGMCDAHFDSYTDASNARSIALAADPLHTDNDQETE